MRKTIAYIALPASLFGLWLSGHVIHTLLIFAMLLVLWIVWDVVVAAWRDEI